MKYLQDHKATGNHDFAVQDDFLALQKTLPGNEPVTCREIFLKESQQNIANNIFKKEKKEHVG